MNASGVHENGKVSLQCSMRRGREMLRAIDFEKLIFRLESHWNFVKEKSKLGSVVRGSVRNKSMLSAKAAVL